jgi:uncharacterized protein with NRDE domain
MCLLSLAFNAHPDFPLVFVGNRDEYHARPSATAGWWDDLPNVLGGRDLQAGGTWLAVNRAGRLAVVTNRPDLPAPAHDSRSRGELVTGWLVDSDVITRLPDQHSDYGGFSLLLAEPGSLQLISGGNGAGKLITHSLSNQIVGLSNTALDEPWPKLTWLNQQVANHLLQVAADKPDIEHLMSLLAQSDPVPESDTQGVPATPFVTGQKYGTRCSTVVTISRQGECGFIERRFGPGGTEAGESAYSFSLAG